MFLIAAYILMAALVWYNAARFLCKDLPAKTQEEYCYCGVIAFIVAVLWPISGAMFLLACVFGYLARKVVRWNI